MERSLQLRGKAAIYPAPDLCRAFDVPILGATRHDRLIHEYLFHGALENAGCYEMIPFDKLLDVGLYEWFPELYFVQKTLWVRVVVLRASLFNKKATPIGLKDVDMTKKLGTCFSRAFTLPMTVAFMTMKKLPWRWETRALPLIARKLCSMTIPGTYTDGQWDDLYAVCEEENLHEVTQFRNVMRALVAYYKKEGERALAMF